MAVGKIQDVPLGRGQFLFEDQAEGQNGGVDRGAGREFGLGREGVRDQHVVDPAVGEEMPHLEIERQSAVHLEGTEPFVDRPGAEGVRGIRGDEGRQKQIRLLQDPVAVVEVFEPETRVALRVEVVAGEQVFPLRLMRQDVQHVVRVRARVQLDLETLGIVGHPGFLVPVEALVEADAVGTHFAEHAEILVTRAELGEDRRGDVQDDLEAVGVRDVRQLPHFLDHFVGRFGDAQQAGEDPLEAVASGEFEICAVALARRMFGIEGKAKLRHGNLLYDMISTTRSSWLLYSRM